MAGELNEFLDFMPDTVTIYPYVSQDVTTKPTYSPTGTSYKARIQMKNHRTIDSKGREVTARGKVFLGTADMIDTRSKIVLPSEYVPVSPPILAANPEPDELGSHHTVLEIG